MAKVIITMLDEHGEKKTKKIHRFSSLEKAEDFIGEHEQDFADDASIYSVDIEK